MNPEYKTYKQAGATFLIPVNVVGEEMPTQEEYENNTEEMERIDRWYEQQIAFDLLEQENNFGHNHIF